jgi:hypothetical protein
VDQFGEAVTTTLALRSGRRLPMQSTETAQNSSMPQVLLGKWRSGKFPAGVDQDSGQVPRFLCDEMLRGLGRWLRAAGYDTVIAEVGFPTGRSQALRRRGSGVAD